MMVSYPEKTKLVTALTIRLPKLKNCSAYMDPLTFPTHKYSK